MDLWNVIPIGVHHYTILSTMVSFLSLGNILWKDTTCKNLLGNESYIVISFHHSILQLTFITQAWMCKFNTCAMQANIWNAHTNAPYKFMSLLPYLCAQNFNWSLFFFIFLPLCHISLSLCLFLSPLFSLPFIFPYLCFSPPLSSMTTKVLNIDSITCRVEIINVNQWGEGHFPKFWFNSRLFIF